jgi:hypothetical protein
MIITATKKNITWFLEYSFIPILLMAVSSFLIFNYGIQAIDAYKDFEQLDFFCEAMDWNDKELNGAIQEKCPSILEINHYVYSPTLHEISSLYEAYGKSSDILALTKTDLTDMGPAIATTAVPFSDLLSATELTSLSSTSLYSYRNVPYAVLIHSQSDTAYNDSHKFTSFLTFRDNQEDTYLLVNAASTNLGSLNDRSPNDAAIQTFRLLLARYDA